MPLVAVAVAVITRVGTHVWLLECAACPWFAPGGAPSFACVAAYNAPGVAPSFACPKSSSDRIK